MSFSDSDLKRLKDDRAKLEAILEDTNTPAYTDKELEMMKMFARNSESPIPMEPLILGALLARLEAAERWGKCHQELCKMKDCKEYEAWRRTKGDNV